MKSAENFPSFHFGRNFYGWLFLSLLFYFSSLGLYLYILVCFPLLLYCKMSFFRNSIVYPVSSCRCSVFSSIPSSLSQFFLLTSSSSASSIYCLRFSSHHIISSLSYEWDVLFSLLPVVNKMSLILRRFFAHDGRDLGQDSEESIFGIFLPAQIWCFRKEKYKHTQTHVFKYVSFQAQKGLLTCTHQIWGYTHFYMPMNYISIPFAINHIECNAFMGFIQTSRMFTVIWFCHKLFCNSVQPMKSTTFFLMKCIFFLVSHFFYIKFLQEKHKTFYIRVLLFSTKKIRINLNGFQWMVFIHG